MVVQTFCDCSYIRFAATCEFFTQEIPVEFWICCSHQKPSTRPIMIKWWIVTFRARLAVHPVGPGASTTPMTGFQAKGRTCNSVFTLKTERILTTKAPTLGKIQTDDL